MQYLVLECTLRPLQYREVPGRCQHAYHDATRIKMRNHPCLVPAALNLLAFAVLHFR